MVSHLWAPSMLAFNEAQPAYDEFGPSEAMLAGWCFVGHDDHADIWHQVSLNNHAGCDITVTVGPIISKRHAGLVLGC